MKKLTRLFTPINVGTMEVKNRIVMPPMHTGYAAPDGTVTERIIDYYEARARGGVGLVIAEAANPNAMGKYIPNTLGFFDDRFIPGWQDMARKVHAHGGKLAVQLFDPGPAGMSDTNGTRIRGPSPVAQLDKGEVPHELSLEEIETFINDFAEAARRAREAEMDAIEIHAAHGYALIGSFMSSFYNKRSDAYGGSLEERLRLLLDVLKAVKARTGNDFPVIVRLAGDDRVSGGRTIQETQFIAPMIVEAGADALEISGGTVPNTFWAVVPPAGTPVAFNADYAEAIKKVVEVPVICVGRINSPQVAEFVLTAEKADMVSMGRALIADPELPNKSAEGLIEDIVPCLACNQGCLVNPWGDVSTSCLMNPSSGREGEMVLTPASNPRRVLVAGGGPAGMEAARVAALRGHEVILFEKEKKLGGQINIASVAPGKQEFIRMVKYLSRQMEKAGVRIEVGKEVTPELVEELKPQAVVVASGGSSLVPEDIPGIDSDRVLSAWDVLAGKVNRPAGELVILGGGSVGCETADFLAELGDNLMLSPTRITVVEMMPFLCIDMSIGARHLMMERLRARGVKFMTSTMVKEISGDSVVVISGGQEETISNVSYIVLAMGVTSVEDLSGSIKDKVDEVHVIGDALEPRKALEAIAQGREIGMKI